VSILLIYGAVLFVTFLVWLIAAIIYVAKAKKDNEDDRTEIDARH
jgi:hypothetical protein